MLMCQLHCVSYVYDHNSGCNNCACAAQHSNHAGNEYRMLPAPLPHNAFHKPLTTHHLPLNPPTQVMWNTKMLARGRRVNREFAFISYSHAREAARAVHWLDGCSIPSLEKDRAGITVEYESTRTGGNEQGSGHSSKR